MRDRYWYTDGKDIPFHLNWRSIDTEASQPAKLWRVSDDDKYPFKKNWRAIPEGLEAPYPAKAWLSHPGDYPFKYKWRNLMRHCPSVAQQDYICVYDMATQQNDFENNGLAILEPIEALITEELNGIYELTLTHPIDIYDKWRYLLEMNIIKACGQLFRIYKRTTSITGNTYQRSISARHIFYDLNDKVLEDVRPTNKDGFDFIDYVMKRTFNDDPEGYFLFYDFSYSSDITKTATSYFQGVTPVAALIGEDNCFLNRLGGELFRDNFYFSINEHKEGAVYHNVPIRYGADMFEIEEDIDYTDFVTYARFYDNFGQAWAVSYVPTARYAHNITRIFRVSHEEPNFDQLVKDGQNYFGSVYQPKITYKIKFANIKGNEKYKDFLELQNYNVGDTVLIYCEELDIVTEQKVVKKVTNALTGETVSIELGNLSGGLTRKDKLDSTVTSGGKSIEEKNNDALKAELRKTKLKLLANWGTAETSTWAEAEEFTWAEVEEV